MRECGDCTLCCTLTKVPELDKPEGITCVFCDNGCSVYDERPTSCRDYQCVWLREELDEELKPSRCGVMFEHLPGSSSYVGMVALDRDGWGEDVEAYCDQKIAEGYAVILNVGAGKRKYVKCPDGMDEKFVFEDLLDAYKKLMA